jgi:hypothetical protein
VADKKFWTGLLAGAAVGYVAYRIIGGAKEAVEALPDRDQAPQQLSFYDSIQGQGRSDYPSTLHGIPTVPLPSVSAAHTRMARPPQAPPPPPPPPSRHDKGESFGGDGMGGMGGESF